MVGSSKSVSRRSLEKPICERKSVFCLRMSIFQGKGNFFTFRLFRTVLADLMYKSYKVSGATDP